MRTELETFLESVKRFMTSAADLLILNLLMLLCCVPVITAGAAWTAGYTGIMRILRGTETEFPIKPFFRDFLRNFKQATLAWLVLLLCAVVLAGDYYYAVYVSEPVNTFFLVFSVAMAVIVFVVSVWLFPLISRFQNTVRGHLMNAVKMSIGMFPKTLLAALIQLVWIGVPFLMTSLFMYLGWIWVFFGMSFPMYITAKRLRKPLECMPVKEDELGQD